MKKIKLILAVIFLLMSNVVWSAAEYDLTSGDFVYTISSNGNAIIKSFIGDSDEANIPTVVKAAKINEDGTYGGSTYHTVTGIGRAAFKDNTTLTYVTMGGSIKTIQDMAFYGCTSLYEIDLPWGLDHFGQEVFAYCHDLELFNIDESQTNAEKPLGTEGGLLFFRDEVGNALEILACAPQALTYVNGDGDIEYNLGNYVTKINGGAFEGCRTLVYTGSFIRIEEIGKNAFKDCINLVQAHVIEAGSGTLTTIGESCFEGCVKLSEIGSCTTLKEIPARAFYACESMKNAGSYPDVTSIGISAFEGCKSLQRIDFTSMENLTIIWNSAFKDCEELVMASYYNTFPAKLESIRYNAFENCKHLCRGGYIQFAEGSALKHIMPDAFRGCYDSNPYRLSRLYIKLPEGLETIGARAFAESEFYTDIDSNGSFILIPSTVKTIEPSAFQGHSPFLYKFEVAAGNSYFKAVDAVLLSADVTRLLCYPIARRREITSSTLDGYVFMPEDDEGYVVPASVREIDSDAFYGSTVPHIVLPSLLTRIDCGTFACSSIKDITIPSKVSVISNSAFYGCQNLTSMFFMPKTPPTIAPGFSFSVLYDKYESPFVSLIDCNLYVQAHKGSSNVENATEHPTNYYKSKYADYIQTSDYPDRPFKRVTHNIPLTMTSSGYMTIGRDFDVMIPHDYKNELKAYVVTGFNSDNATVTLKQLVVNHPAYPANDYKSVQHIPARYKDSDGYNAKYVGVILKGTPNKSYSIWMPRADYSVADEDRFTLQSDYNNELHTDLVETYKETEDDYNYIFLLKGGKIRKASANGIIAYNKAYLKLRKAAVDDMYSKGLGAKPLTAIFEDYDGTTSIDTIPADVLIGGNCNDDVFYTLTGIPVKNPGKGIYIKNGKKIVIR